MDTQFMDFLTDSVYIDGENLALILSRALGVTLNKTQAQTFASAILSSTTGGDVDNNGKRTKEDIEVIIQYLHGKQLLTDPQKNIADVTGDNMVRVNDIVAIQKLIAEAYIPHTPTASMTMTPTASPTVSVTATPSMTITYTHTPYTPTKDDDGVPINTPSPTSTYTPTPTVSSTMSPTPTLTPTETPSPTETPEPNLLTLEGTGANAGVYINNISSIKPGQKLGGFTVVLSGNVTGSVVSDFVMGSSQGFTYDSSKNVTIISGVSKVRGGTTIDDQRIINITSSLDATSFVYSDSRFMVSDQYGRVMNPGDYPTLTMELVSSNRAKITLRPYTIRPHNKSKFVSNFQFDYSGIRLKHLAGVNPLRGYNISVGESRVLIFTMQVDKYSIPLDVNRSYTFEFEYDSLINMPHVRSAMFVDSGINLASYALMHPTEPELMFSQSVPYVGIDQEIDVHSPFMMNMANVTAGRDTFYYGDLTSSTDPAIWIGSTAWLPSPDGSGKVDGDNDINTGHINVDDLTLALRMFVDAQLYNGTRAINQSTAQTEDEKIYVTRMQQLLVYADRTDTQNMYSTAATYTVNGNSLDLYDPPATFNLSKLRHILKMVKLALSDDTVDEYEGVVDAEQNDYGNIVVKVSGQDTRIRVYFTKPDGTLVGNTDLGDFMDFHTGQEYYDNKTYTIPFELFNGFVYGTDELRVTGIESDPLMAIGMYVNVTTEEVFAVTPTMTHTFTPSPTITSTIGDVVVDYSIPPSVIDDATKDNVYTFKVASGPSSFDINAVKVNGFGGFDVTPYATVEAFSGSSADFSDGAVSFAGTVLEQPERIDILSGNFHTSGYFYGAAPLHESSNPPGKHKFILISSSQIMHERAIQYDIATKVWEDAGSDVPDSDKVTQSGSTVSGAMTGHHLFTFNDPYENASMNFGDDAVVKVTVPRKSVFDVKSIELDVPVEEGKTYKYASVYFQGGHPNGSNGNSTVAMSDFKWKINGSDTFEYPLYDITNKKTYNNINGNGTLIDGDEAWPSGYQWGFSSTSARNTGGYVGSFGSGSNTVDVHSISEIRAVFYDAQHATGGFKIVLHDEPPSGNDAPSGDGKTINFNMTSTPSSYGGGSHVTEIYTNPDATPLPPTFNLFKNDKKVQATVADYVYTLPVASPTLSFVGAENKMRVEDIPIEYDSSDFPLIHLSGEKEDVLPSGMSVNYASRLRI